MRIKAKQQSIIYLFQLLIYFFQKLSCNINNNNSEES